MNMQSFTEYSQKDKKTLDNAMAVLSAYEDSFISSYSRLISDRDPRKAEKVQRALYEDPQREMILKSISNLTAYMVPTYMVLITKHKGVLGE